MQIRIWMKSEQNWIFCQHLFDEKSEKIDRKILSDENKNGKIVCIRFRTLRIFRDKKLRLAIYGGDGEGREGGEAGVGSAWCSLGNTRSRYITAPPPWLLMFKRFADRIYHVISLCMKKQQRSAADRLAFFGIMWLQLRASLKPFILLQHHYGIEGLKRALK